MLKEDFLKAACGPRVVFARLSFVKHISVSLELHPCKGCCGCALFADEDAEAKSVLALAEVVQLLMHRVGSGPMWGRSSLASSTNEVKSPQQLRSLVRTDTNEHGSRCFVFKMSD